MSAAEHLQGQLFDLPEPEVQSDISAWAKRNWWHASKKGTIPQDSNKPHLGFGLGFHVGTTSAALDRTEGVFEDRILHPVELHGDFETIAPAHKKGVAADKGRGPAVVWQDWPANTHPQATSAIKRGNNIAYVNVTEHAGSISVRAPRSNIRTWSEAVVANPENFSASERKAAREGWSPVYSRKSSFNQREQYQTGVTGRTPVGVGPLKSITIPSVEHDPSSQPSPELHGAWARPYDPKYVKEKTSAKQEYLPGLDPNEPIREGLNKVKMRIGLPQPIGSSFK